MKLFDARTSVRFVERQFNYMYLNQDKRSYQNCLKGNTNQLNETCRKKSSNCSDVNTFCWYRIIVMFSLIIHQLENQDVKKIHVIRHCLANLQTIVESNQNYGIHVVSIL